MSGGKETIDLCDSDSSSGESEIGDIDGEPYTDESSSGSDGDDAGKKKPKICPTENGNAVRSAPGKKSAKRPLPADERSKENAANGTTSAFYSTRSTEVVAKKKSRVHRGNDSSDDESDDDSLPAPSAFESATASKVQEVKSSAKSQIIAGTSTSSMIGSTSKGCTGVIELLDDSDDNDSAGRPRAKRSSPAHRNMTSHIYSKVPTKVGLDRSSSCANAANDYDGDDSDDSSSLSSMDRKPRAKSSVEMRISSKQSKGQGPANGINANAGSTSAITLLSDSDEDSLPDAKPAAASQRKSGTYAPAAARDEFIETSSVARAKTSTSLTNNDDSSSDLETPFFQSFADSNRDSSMAKSATTKTPRGQRNNNATQNNFRNLVASPSQPQMPTPAIPTVSPQTLQRIGGRLYPDLRHAFIKRLSAHARSNRRATHQKATFNTTVRAITVLALRPHPIRSAEATKQINGIGDDLVSVLKDAATDGGRNPYVPRKGKFSAVAPAAVVAAFEYESQNPSQPLCSMEELIRRTNLFLDPQANASLTKPVDYYLSKDTMDPGWSQVQKLCSENIHAGLLQLLKQRRNKKLCASGVVFELTSDGRAAARRFQKAMKEGPVEPGPLRELAADTVNEEYGHVTMSMDFREGGGGSNSLHKMCDWLDRNRVPYVVRQLKISDYLFFVRNKLAPILIERKTIDDVANSLADGRWLRQQRTMRKAQFVLGGGAARRCQLCYLIEGDASRSTVHGGNVGRTSWNQSLEDVENAIAELPRLGFSVVRTRSHLSSIVSLAEIAKDVSWKAKNGSIDATLTYEQFTSSLRMVDEKEADPPTLREHQYPAPPIVNAASAHRESSPDMQANGMSGTPDAASESASASEQEIELKKLSVADLKEKCKERDEKISGSKAELISRLLKPRKPELLIARARQGEYVPKVPSCNAALMVALLLSTRPGEGKEKDELMTLAEACGVSKEAMDARNGYYDGWAGVKDLKKGDPALLCMKKKTYCLTTQPPGTSGWDVARALHILAHREGICKCGNHVMG